MQASHPPVQAIRSVLRNSRNTPTTPDPPDAVHVDIYTDPKTKKQFVLWDDIRLAFDDALHVRHLSRVVPFVKGDDLIPSHATDASIRLRNKDQAVQTVKEIMKKIAAHVDLEVLHEKGDGSPKNFPKALECYLKTFHQGHALALISVGDLFVNGQGVTQDPSLAMAWYFKAACQGDNNTQRKFEALRLAESRRVATAPNASLEAAADEQLAGKKQLSVEDTTQGTQPKPRQGENKTGEEGSVAYTTSTTPTASTVSVSRRTVHGPEETDMDNTENPAITPASSAPQILSTDNNQHKSDILEPQYSGDKIQPQAPQEHTDPATKNFARTMASVTLGDKDVQVTLGDMYRDGVGVPQDYRAAMDWYLKAAEQGQADAQFNVGIMFANGQGVPKDYSRAMDWYRKAADQGNAAAQFNIGILYRNGQGMPQDCSQAMNWYRRAAIQGNAHAENGIGEFYYFGRGVPQDYSQAMDWYRKAADQGYAAAQFNIGVLHKNGEGVPQDYSQAMDWYRKAADQGYAAAQFNIGVLHKNGEGVPQDYSQAMDWYRKAANQGHASAQFSIHVLYRDGQDMPKDYVMF
ncbi:hypothetical protein BGX29_012098 [Mortierella sp. GBA35]|nr:hypothetical protein BGX29_012098 [Mortierella sp. GBA35]